MARSPVRRCPPHCGASRSDWNPPRRCSPPLPRAGVSRTGFWLGYRHARSPVRRLARWLTAPHPVTLRIRPVWSLALAASLVLLMLLPEERSTPVLGEHEGIAQFVARFPGAHSVQVVGSFNDWRTGTIPLEDRDGDGVWRAVVVLPAGAHEYMFVVDDERWVPDYSANRFVEDDFGRENSVLIVRPVKG